jgi:hypothetical protein
VFPSFSISPQKITGTNKVKGTNLKVRIELSLCLTNYALRHEGVWRSGCVDSGGQLHAPVASPDKGIRGWVSPRAGLDTAKLKLLPPQGLELRSLGRLVGRC